MGAIHGVTTEPWSGQTVYRAQITHKRQIADDVGRDRKHEYVSEGGSCAEARGSDCGAQAGRSAHSTERRRGGGITVVSRAISSALRLASSPTKGTS